MEKDVMNRWKLHLKRMCALLMVALLLVSSLGLPATQVSAATKAKGFTLNKTSLALMKGKTATLKASNNTQEKGKIVWSSSNKKIATVTSKGVVKGIKNGTATITAKITGSDQKAICKVTVKTAATKLTLDKTSATVKVGETVTISGVVSPKTASNKTLVFRSSDESIAAASSKGVIQGIKAGTATITVVVKNTKVKATCEVTVVEAKKAEVTPTPVATPTPGVVTTQPGGYIPEVVNPNQVKLDKSEITLDEAATATIVATVYPVNASNKTVVFRSSNNEIATVNASGVVTAVKEGEATITATVQGTSISADCKVTVKKVRAKLSYEGYNLKWSDEFDGTALNKADWNVETHGAGWVNSELQEYVDSDQNISVKDGNLVITPIKTVKEDGTATYTSGRINTQNKHNFTYGLFEVRAKVPAGQGYLPAFWMMAADENVYGQWPRCGEIDIMEIMGQKTDKLYGTIHYGNPHSESQGTYVLTEDNFADNYHTFSCEWEPGKIRWYVDGMLYHEESDWYTATVGQGTVTYPAPFDQPFYMILNLAVGGSWVGNPDASTDFDKAAFTIDYVKAYQKDSYNENVTKPVKEVVLRDPDVNGNYVNNSDFAIAEDLTDKLNWVSLTALGGEAAATIADKQIKIATTNAGTADYSVQLVQAGIPLEKGATYTVSFDAQASAARTMKTAVKAPDRGYAEYMNSKTVDLSTDKQTYTYEFKMESDSDANGRLEFNMGAAGSTADIYISNVSIKKTKPADPNEKEIKTILADGNYVYNGSFQEGDARLGYWEITNTENASVSVTNENTDRRLKVVVTKEEARAEDVVAAQTDLAIQGGKEYALSFDAQADAPRNMKILVAGQEFVADLTADKKSFSFKVTLPASITNKNLAFYLGDKGTTYLDNVRLVEDAMIKNGSFNAGFAGYEWYADSSADASSVVDSLTEDNAADITIKNTGDQDWKIQLKQNNVALEKGQWYKLTFKAKSNLPRKIRVIMQGLEDKKWAAYGENIVSLTDSYQTFEKEFMMAADTDPKAFLCFALGAVGGEVITTQHRVCIDDISLVKIDAPTTPEVPEIEAGVNMLKNPDFANESMSDWSETIATDKGAVAVKSISGSAITYDISNPGTDDWNVQLKQNYINLKSGRTYKVSFDVTTTASRVIKLAIMSKDYKYFAGTDIDLEGNVSKSVEFEFTMNSDSEAGIFISMGKIVNKETPPSAITLSKLSFIRVDK